MLVLEMELTPILMLLWRKDSLKLSDVWRTDDQANRSGSFGSGKLTLSPNEVDSFV